MTAPPNHSDIYRALGQIEGRMEGLEKAITEGFDRLSDLLSEHDSRIKAVESYQAEQRGHWKLLTLLGGAAAAVGGLIVSAWSHIFGAS